MGAIKMIRADRESVAELASGFFGNLRADRVYKQEQVVSGWYQISSPMETPDEHFARIDAEEESGRRADREWKREQPYRGSIQKGMKHRVGYVHYKTGKEVMQSPRNWYSEIWDTRLEGEQALVRFLRIHSNLKGAVDEVLWELNGMRG